MSEHEQVRVHIVGAATSAAAHGPGQERAPEAFRAHGLLERLTAAGLEVIDHGDVVHFRMEPDPDHPKLQSVDRVVEAARTVAGQVQRISQSEPDARILVLGGDCSIQLGVIAGAKAAAGAPHARVGLAYIDLDCDLTSPQSGNGIADWMGITHLLDAPDADARLASLGGPRPLLTRHTLRLVAADRANAYEQSRIDDLSLTRYLSQQVEEHTADVLAELAAWADGLSLLSVHVDVDVLDQTAFPIAEEQRSDPGLSVAGLGRLVTGLMSHPTARIITICEVNPDRPDDPASAFAELNTMLAAALSARR